MMLSTRTVHRALYRLGEAIHGWNVLERIEQLGDMEHWPREQIESFQVEKLKRLLRHAYENVPFYRSFWDGAGVHPNQVETLGDLSGFPRVTKALLVQAGDTALDQSRSKRRFLRKTSSGSSGEPLVYYETKAHHSWSVAAAMHGWTWAGWRPGDRWIRSQYCGRLGLLARIEHRLFHCLYMPLDVLDGPFVHRFVEKAVRFKPMMLRGYAGGTYVFAKFLLDSAETRLRPKVVITTGDTLYPHYRQAIEEAFGCPVFDAYGGEGIVVANQCERGSYHMLPVVHVEWEPEGAPMAEGQPGRLILTSLTNYAMPMIRYDIGDIAIPGTGSCPCGRSWPVLKKIIGRETDIVVTPSGRNLVCHHFNNVIRTVAGVDQFQVIQDEPGGVILRLVTNPTYEKHSDQPHIAAKLEELGGAGFSVQVEYVTSMPVPPSGKRRYIISKVSSSGGTRADPEST